MALGDDDGQESSQLRDGVLSFGFGSGRSGPVQSSPVGCVVEAGDCSNKLGVSERIFRMHFVCTSVKIWVASAL